MKATNPWITYRTRFLVKAKQLTTSLTFSDVLGRQHSGRKGDYLVESSDGVLRIAPRQIFEDIYVPLLSRETLSRETLSGETLSRETLSGEMLSGEIPELQEPPRSFSLPPHLTRKSPQPDRNGRSSSPGLRSL
jgi:hypothetical protein